MIITSNTVWAKMACPKIEPDQVLAIHDMKHFILAGYNNTPDPVRTLRSHILSPKLVAPVAAYTKAETKTDPLAMPSTQGLVLQASQRSAYITDVQATGLVQTPGASNFMFEQNPNAENEAAAKEALAIATGLIKQTKTLLAAEGVTLRLISIPAFPPAFFAQTDSTSWTAEIDNLDLFKPERALAAFAETEAIPFLAMGNYLETSPLSISEIEALFFLQGQGHLTPVGHGFFAQAIYDCFYSNPMETSNSPSLASCYSPDRQE